uniref:Matrix Gla protein n=1 Tax=Sus scrofa TaxID=9823 RepID=A0A8D1ME49_PIG
MKSLLLLSVLAALAVAALCYESHESLESYEINPFLNRRNANTFISPQQRWRAKAQERWVTELQGGGHFSQHSIPELNGIRNSFFFFFSPSYDLFLLTFQIK